MDKQEQSHGRVVARLAKCVKLRARLVQEGRNAVESSGARQPGERGLEELEHLQKGIRRRQERSSRQGGGGDSLPYGR